MIYYKKEFYYVRLNESQKCYLELFDSQLQMRIMEIKNENLYDDLVIRVQNGNFETITNTEFDNKLIEIKNKLF